MYARDNAAAAAAVQELPGGERIEAAAETFRLLADPTRLRLMWLLGSGEYDVSSLTQLVGAPRPAVSQHLAKLRLAGAVASRRDGRRVVYRTRTGHLRAVITHALEQADHHLGQLPDHD